MQNDICREVESLDWEEHPKFKNVFVKYLLTKRDNDSNITYLLVKTLKGTKIPKHVHEKSVDIIYPLKGKGEIHIDGFGDFAYVPGNCIIIPKNIPHNVDNVEETLIAIDIFDPATI